MAIGFIGLGNMGFGMASNLLNAGNKLHVFDIDLKNLDSVVKLGGQKMTPPNMAKHVEVIILCLPHPDISKDIVTNSILSKGRTVKTIIDTSTLTPDSTLFLYEKCKEKKVNFLCAPMLGGKNAAMNKMIHFLIEGDKPAFEENKDLFSHMGTRFDYMGSAPTATLAKLAYNICRYSNLATAAEVSRLIRSYTKDTKSTYELLTEGSLDNFGQVWAEDITEMMLDGKPYYPSKIPEKDLTLVMELQKKQKLPTNFISALKEVYRSLEE